MGATRKTVWPQLQGPKKCTCVQIEGLLFCFVMFFNHNKGALLRRKNIYQYFAAAAAKDVTIHQ